MKVIGGQNFSIEAINAQLAHDDPNFKEGHYRYYQIQLSTSIVANYLVLFESQSNNVVMRDLTKTLM
jgi:hypothetical protein